jgi:hypothetical protein
MNDLSKSALSIRAVAPFRLRRGLLSLMLSMAMTWFCTQAQSSGLNPVTFAPPVNLASGSYFPVRTVANITHPDPANATVDVTDPIDFDGDGNSDNCPG